MTRQIKKGRDCIGKNGIWKRGSHVVLCCMDGWRDITERASGHVKRIGNRNKADVSWQCEGAPPNSLT